jgi:signal transduction histidine kinase
MIANILRAAEVEHRGEELPVAPGEVDLCAYLREYLEDATASHAGAVRLSLAGEEEAWVEIDPVMFRQVLDNLVDNAIRYRGDRPAVVDLRVVRAGGEVELQVTDQGIGIPAAMLEAVFERFYQVEGRRTGRRGMGIGLHVVRSIVRSHGGTVGARSGGPGAGTTVWVRLPAIGRTAVQA